MKNEQAPFAARIKKLRNESDLTQQQLADLVGVSQTTVWHWETGRRDVPNGDNMLKLARAFGLDVVQFGSATESAHTSSEEVQLLAAFRSLPKERRLIAINLLEALK